jgi:hypothetical protein
MIRNLILILSFSGIVLAQEFKQITLDHPLAPESFIPNPELQRTDGSTISHLNVLAVMVEFTPDDDDRTSGDGTFDISTPSKPHMDAPPRTIEYFRHHLSFVSNYFSKVSDGKLTIATTLLDSIFRLPQQMRYYSPLKSSTTNAELGLLMRDVWRTVDSLTRSWGISVSYDDYDAFIIFHAGVGRDIDLVSVYGYDPTPFDIPSIYINLASLRTMFEDPEFPGIVINDGMDTIKNSLVIPETESREQVPFPLGINGLLAASIGSHLGLPDLFNTKTGRSGIGRFGLMDGQAIFSWNGAFPPEPSAWEKYFLGWLEPITVHAADSIYVFPAVSFSPDSIYRVLLSGREYLFLENRNRDANRDGAVVRLAVGSDVVSREWTRDTVGFTQDDQDSLIGVVVDIDEYDWSLPGGYEGSKEVLHDGGILIWHIDERIIDENLLTNSVNADENLRGVDLEEADGSQDIGQSYNFLEPGSGSESGTIFDYWYAGNDAPMRRHDTAGFTPTSFPNSLTNDHANSHISVKSFSPRGPRMTAKIVIGDDVARPLTGFPQNVGYRFGSNSITIVDESNFMLVNTENRKPDSEVFEKSRIYGWNFYDQPIFEPADSSGMIFESEHTADLFAGVIASDKLDGDEIPDITIGAEVTDPGNQEFINTMRGWGLKDENIDQRIDQFFIGTVSEKITTSPVISDSLIAYGAAHGTVYFFNRQGKFLDSIVIGNSDTSSVVGLSLLDNPGTFVAATENGLIATIQRAGTYQFETKSIDIGKKLSKSPACGILSPPANKRIVVVTDDGFVYHYDSQLDISNGFPVALSGKGVTSPALADIDGDGSRDIIVFSGAKIYAINCAGAMVDNFPIQVSTDNPILASPIVADIDGNGKEEITAVTQEGLVFAYDRDGKVLNGFPLLAGVNNGSTPAVFYMSSPCLSCVDIGLAVASDDGYVYAWKTGSLVTGLTPPPVMSWPQFLRDARKTSLIEKLISGVPRSEEFFPSSLAYNWPNPVSVDQGFITFIRYYVKEAARVHIKIFDASGDMITEFDGPGIGGIENEISWNVSEISSGIYFAHVEASGLNGGDGSAIIKIAVVK